MRNNIITSINIILMSPNCVYGLAYTANWNAMSAFRKRFQFRSPKDYYVNHMSAYEHGTRKKQGYNVSEAKTVIFSTAAKNGECGAVGDDFNPNTLGILPFYGGRPPGVMADNTGTLKVTSIGQGNSLVSFSRNLALITMCYYPYEVYYVSKNYTYLFTCL